ncbi:MAG: hypothetical protein R2861_12355 [Desulfobacterales bacterium]
MADSDIIFKRGERLFEYGACINREADFGAGRFVYEVDGNYGDYTIEIDFSPDEVECFVTAPIRGTGCKHTVAAPSDIMYIPAVPGARPAAPDQPPGDESPWLSREEIRSQAMEDRKRRAKSGKNAYYPGRHEQRRASGGMPGKTVCGDPS